MKITFEFPEVLIISACVLFCFSHITCGWVFLSLGVLSSICRAGMNVHEKTLKEESAKENIGNAVDAFSEFLKASAQPDNDTKNID